MGVSIRETCQEYFKRRLSEGWKCIWLDGYNAILLSPDGLRREIDLRNDTETLRPSTAGDLTELDPVPVVPNWQNVDDTGGGDDDTTYNNQYDDFRDTYNLPASSGSGTINKITVYVRVKTENLLETDYNILIRVSSTTYYSSKTNMTTSYVLNNAIRTQNPYTVAAWTWADIDALQIGIQMASQAVPTYWQRVTQVYVEIDYTEAAAGRKTPFRADSRPRTRARFFPTLGLG
ncbi:hypothetical protein LCGC14_0263500 [marine sediment metagenome]|uniref:Uncharacterized protein n=1 Tax=marine sediment metagenome TaxID=412755 RepID=A0A0F9U1G3_9ZZZZ